MNKKKLIAQNEELYNMLKQNEANNASLKKRVDELMIMLGAKDFEISELKKEIEKLKSVPKQVVYVSNTANNAPAITELENNEQPIETEKQEELVFETENVETVAKTVAEQSPAEPPTESPNLTVKYINTEQIDDEIQKIAAKAISNISLKAAMLSNQLATSGNPNAKDLLTLTLGRSEVFKQKVFEITKSGVNFDSAKASINLLEAEILEYFEQLKAQL